MKEKLSAWEKAYREVILLWGLQPDHLLIKYAKLIPKGKVLDLGIGEGRNALFLAKMGYEVEGIDISETAIERCAKRAKDANLRVNARVEDLRRLDIPPSKYSLIIAAWVFQFLRKSEVKEVITKIKNGLRKDGLVYIGTFSLDDPGYKKAKQNLKVVEQNTFYSKKQDIYINYFTKEEILSLFADFKIIYYADGMELDISHGKPHYHGFIEYMGEKC